MGKVTLTGFLICRSLDEADRAAHLLPEHIRLTRAELGCLVFEVIRSMSDPLRFAVREVFADRAAFESHQTRTAGSHWGRATQGIGRDFVLTEKDRETQILRNLPEAGG